MKHRVVDILIILTGSVLFALSVSVFSAPSDIAPGGASGLSILAHTLWGIPIGIGIVLINTPLLIAAFFVLSKRFAVGSAVAIVISSAVMDGLAPFLPVFDGEQLMAALCGGLLQGLGVGLVLLRGVSTGGTEIAAYLLQKRWRHLSPGRLMMAVDAVVVALSAVVYGDISAAMAAATQVLVCSVTVDQVLFGRQEGRLVMAVTNAPKRLCEAIATGVMRGATVMDVKGGYTGEAKSMVLCAVSRAQLPMLTAIVKEQDAGAFVMILATQQVVGEGFLPHG